MRRTSVAEFSGRMAPAGTEGGLALGADMASAGVWLSNQRTPFGSTVMGMGAPMQGDAVCYGVRDPMSIGESLK